MGFTRPGSTDQNQVVGALHEGACRQLLDLRLRERRFRPVDPGAAARPQRQARPRRLHQRGIPRQQRQRHADELMLRIPILEVISWQRRKQRKKPQRQLKKIAFG